MKDELELSRRKMLAGIGVVGATSAGAGLGTSAFFSDRERFADNTLVAGELDLMVDWQEHYSDWSDDENDDVVGSGFLGDPDENDTDLDGDGVDDFDVVMTNGDPGAVPTGYVGLPVPMEPLIAVPLESVGDFMTNTSIEALPDWNDDGVQSTIYTRNEISNNHGLSGDQLEAKFRSQFANMPIGLDSDARTESSRAAPLIDLQDVKPGDFGEVTFSFHLFDNPGYVRLVGGLVEAAENDHTEPESSDSDEVGPPGEVSADVATAQVELLDEIQVLVWHDDGDNVLSGPNYESQGEQVHVPHDVGSPTAVFLSQEEAIVHRGTLRELLSLLETDGIPLDSDPRDPARDCYPNSTTRYLCLAWWLPVDHANELQGDSVAFDLGFYTEQCRHNDGSRLVVDSNGNGDFSSIQAAIDASDDGDEIFVLDGTYEETLDIDGRSDLTVRGAPNADVTVRPTSTLPWGSETNFPGRTTGIRVVESTGVTLHGLTFDFEAIDDTAINGLLFWESDGRVWDSTLEGMSNANDAVDLTSYLGTNDPGSSAYSDTDRARIEFRNNEFVETGRIGINAEDFVEAIVVDNTFETTDAGYAVEIGSEATGLVQNNEIHGYNTNFSDGSESAGIYVENAFPASGVSLVKDVAVIGNEVYDCTVGIRVGNEFHTIAGDVDIEATLVGNYVHDNDTGISVTDSGAEDGSSVSVVGSNNVLENNGEGYHLFEDNGASEEDDGNITFDVEAEEIIDNDVGVLVGSASTPPVTSFQSVAVTGSVIENNANFGIRNDVGNLTVDAEDNWWGASDGPSGQGPGSGDAVSSNVDFSPFANSP